MEINVIIYKTDEWTYIVEDAEGNSLAKIVDCEAIHQVEIDAAPILPIVVKTCANLQDTKPEIEIVPRSGTEQLQITTPWDCVVFNWK